ncbi:MAG: carbonic anhydrase [Vampirovibrionales bacterium]|nr:carbonic anhydrase [Vampirovibrionales bacterium]
MPRDPQASLNDLIRGVRKFQRDVYPGKQELFKTLAKGQSPKILFITCSDSRIDPSLITQSDPGSLFLIHNAGNIVPPHGTPYGGTGASIEYAVSVLEVEHIIVCGHSACGAMTALCERHQGDGIPIIRQWISYADATRAILDTVAHGADEAQRLERCIEINVAVQMHHLETIPSVAARMAAKTLALHGWVYHIESGEIDVYDPLTEGFKSFEQAYQGQTSIV